MRAADLHELSGTVTLKVGRRINHAFDSHERGVVNVVSFDGGSVVFVVEEGVGVNGVAVLRLPFRHDTTHSKHVAEGSRPVPTNDEQSLDLSSGEVMVILRGLLNLIHSAASPSIFTAITTIPTAAITRAVIACPVVARQRD